jgi:hypothetical protein
VCFFFNKVYYSFFLSNYNPWILLGAFKEKIVHLLCSKDFMDNRIIRVFKFSSIMVVCFTFGFFCFKIIINQLWRCYNAYIFFQTCVKSYKSNTFYFFDLHVEGAFMSTKLVQVVAWLLNDILWFWNGKFAWSNHNYPSFSNVQEQHISMLKYTMS